MKRFRQSEIQIELSKFTRERYTFFFVGVSRQIEATLNKRKNVKAVKWQGHVRRFLIKVSLCELQVSFLSFIKTILNKL